MGVFPLRVGIRSQAAMEIFVRAKEASAREIEVIRCITDNDRVQVIVGDVRIDASGMQKGGGGKKKGGGGGGKKKGGGGRGKGSKKR